MKGRAPALVFAAAAAASCGGDRATNAPSNPRPSPAVAGLSQGAIVTVVMGDTGAPAVGASVTIGDRAYVSDAEGRVVVTSAAVPGTLVDVTAPGAFDRQTAVRTRPAGSLALWPLTTRSGIDEAFTTAIVYTTATREGGPPGADPLRRHPDEVRTVVVVPTPEILADSAAHAAQVEGAARLTAAARGALAYALAAERPATGALVSARMGPDEGCTERVRAFARVSLSANAIVGGEIVYCSWDAARSATTAAHEMGHTFGLRHSNDSRDVMFPTFIRGRSPDFREREADIMALMMQRPAGNRFPDSDRGVGPASNRMDIVVCY